MGKRAGPSPVVNLAALRDVVERQLETAAQAFKAGSLRLERLVFEEGVFRAWVIPCNETFDAALLAEALAEAEERIIQESGTNTSIHVAVTSHAHKKETV